MKKQNKSNWQTIVFAAIATVVFMFAGNLPASAQTENYKVGDIVETMSAGDWVKVKITEIRDTGEYVVCFLNSGICGAWLRPDNIRPVKSDAQTNNRNSAVNQTQNRTDGNAQPKTDGGAAPAQKEKSIGEIYGSREPRICSDTKAPAKGAMTAALALKYLKCQMEYVSSGHLYLVENLKVEVGGGIPYAAIIGQRSLSEINVRVPVYPIRGSLVRYQCKNSATEHVGPPDTNCNTYNEPKASGYCYKTTFGDWKCYMSDGSNNKENFRTNVAPPKP